MSSMMKAILLKGFGGPENLVYGDFLCPKPADDEVLIRVQAAGVNRPDCLQREGKYPPPIGASEILGLEIAGEIIELGKNVTDWRVGDRVCALLSGGGYATFATAHKDLCLPWPTGLSAPQAAALPETIFTVWHNVFARGQLQANEWLLIHGGASGIGTTAIQLARAFGANVVVTVGADWKKSPCLQLGAHHVINHSTQDFVNEIKVITGNRGVDVILDMVGGDYTPRNLNALAEDGRLVQIAVLRGAKTEVDLFKVMIKRLTITGSTLRSRPTAVKAQIAREVQKSVWPLILQGKFSPHLDSTFSLTEAATAHRYLETSQHVGKIALLTH